MGINIKKFNQIFLFSLILLVSACVGTVEDGKQKKTDTSVNKETSVVFKGIDSAQGIADDKIEVFFPAAQGGTGQYDYYIYYGGGEIPVVVPSDVLTPDYRGLLRYTLVDLLPGTKFQLKIDVKDQVTNEETVTDKFAETETFYNDVCDFNGISKVENLSGIDGVDSIRVYWAQAKSNSDGLLKNPDSDPDEFEIDLIKTSTFSPGDFDNDNLNGGVGRYFSSVSYDANVTDAVIRGLPSSTEFFIRVRCIHKTPVSDVSKPYLYSELNTKYLRISTLSQDLSDIAFDPDEVFLVNGVANEAGTFTVNWGQISGVFDHYRIYYSEGAVSVTDDCKLKEPSSGVFCKKASYQDTSAIINPLNDGNTYNVMFVICQTPECSNASERIVVKTFNHDTLPTVSPFLGIEGVGFAEKVSDLGSIYVQFTPPNLAQGYFDGFVINYKDTPVSSPVDITDASYSGSISVDNYDPYNVSRLKVNNIPYYSAQCFNVQIFIYDANGDRIIYPNDVWECATPSIVTPTKTEFLGFQDGLATENQLNSSISISWLKPQKGIYSEYIMFVRHSVGAFSFAEARTQTATGDYSNYWRISVPDGYTNYSLSFLDPGTYRMGMVTHHTDYTGSHFSEYNENILTCVINTPPGDGSTVVNPCSL